MISKSNPKTKEEKIVKKNKTNNNINNKKHRSRGESNSVLQSGSSGRYHDTIKPDTQSEKFKYSILKKSSTFPEVPEEDRSGAVGKPRSDGDRTSIPANNPIRLILSPNRNPFNQKCVI